MSTRGSAIRPSRQERTHGLQFTMPKSFPRRNFAFCGTDIQPIGPLGFSPRVRENSDEEIGMNSDPPTPDPRESLSHAASQLSVSEGNTTPRGLWPLLDTLLSTLENPGILAEIVLAESGQDNHAKPLDGDGDPSLSSLERLESLRQLGTFAQAARCFLYVRDGGRGERTSEAVFILVGKLGVGNLPRRVREAESPGPPSSLMLRAATTRESLFLDDVDQYRKSTGLALSPHATPRQATIYGPSCMVLPLVYEEETWGVLNFSSLRDTVPAPDANQRHALLHGARLLAIAARNARDRAGLERRASRDGVTHLYNYATFQDLLRREVLRAQRYAASLSLILLDLDDFKEINDRFGHLAGDQILAEIARRMRFALRAPDLPARCGGDEFAVLLPQTSLDGALQVARRIHQNVVGDPITYLETRIQVTVSLGVAQLQEPMTAVELVRRADEQLYRAKREGRNRVGGSALESL